MADSVKVIEITSDHRGATERCSHCGNPALPIREEIEYGITSARCVICGDQNYQYPQHMRSSDDPCSPDMEFMQPSPKTCLDCGDDIYGMGNYCDNCRKRRYWVRNAVINANRRKNKAADH